MNQRQKSNVLIVVSVAMAMVFIGLHFGVRTTEVRTEHTVSSYMVPVGTDEIPLTQQFNNELQVSPQTITRLHIVPPASYSINDIYTFNIDRDSELEQLVFFKEPSIGSNINIMLVDYDYDRDVYIRSWEGATAIHDSTSIQIEIIDITQDGMQECIISGIDQDGIHIMYIYTISEPIDGATNTLSLLQTFTSPSFIGIELRQSFIGNIVASVLPTVVIDEVFTATAVNGEAPNGQVLDVFRDSTNNEEILGQGATGNTTTSTGNEAGVDSTGEAATSDTSTEQVIEQTSFQWSVRENRFISTVFELPVAQQIDERFSNTFINAPEQKGLEALNGIWYSDSQPQSITMIIDSNSSKLEIYREHQQTAFVWDVYRRSLSGAIPSFHFALNNENITSLSSRASITVLNADTIVLVIAGATQLSSELTRISESPTVNTASYIDNETVLTGWYHGNSGDSMVSFYFNSPFVRIITDSTTATGTYTIGNANARYIEITLYDTTDKVTDRLLYALNSEHSIESGVIERNIILIPAIALVNGIVRINSPQILLTQAHRIQRR